MNYISFIFQEGTKHLTEIFFLIFIVTTVLATLLLLYLSFMFHKEGEKVAFNKSIAITIYIFAIGLIIYTAHIEIVLYKLPVKDQLKSVIFKCPVFVLRIFVI